MVIFHSYVSLPEGVYVLVMVSSSYFLDNYLPASFLLGYASKESYVDKDFLTWDFHLNSIDNLIFHGFEGQEPEIIRFYLPIDIHHTVH